MKEMMGGILQLIALALLVQVLGEEVTLKDPSSETANIYFSGSDLGYDVDVADVEDVAVAHGDVVSKEPLSLSASNENQVLQEIIATNTVENIPSLAEEGEPLVALESAKVNETTNVTVNETESSEDKNSSSIVVCHTGKENTSQPVELVNSTRLISLLISESNVTDRRTPADCVLVLFYARFCPFSSMAAPHFNALPRVFPDLKIAAVDAMKYHSFNTQFGIVGVPTLLLFHNGRPAAKFNDSEYTLEMFSKFITKYTGITPDSKLFVTSADFGGPVSSVPSKETDYCLILSCIFIFICGMYFFSKSSWWQWITEAVQNTWREAEAQHEHGD